MDRFPKLAETAISIPTAGLIVYEHLSPDWVDPLCPSIPLDKDLQWPWNYPRLQLPSTMPSGKPWPKISVVTVTFNQAAYIEETIRSILWQGYPNLEYIVFDGASTDNTLEILERYKSEIAYCISEPDKGQSNALNKGFARATGEILAWLNSDDCYLPGTLARVAIAFDSYKTDMVVGGCELREGNCSTPFKTHHSALPVGQSVKLPLDRLLNIDSCWFAGEFFYQPEVFWTRDLWQRVGAHVREDLYYSMDYELWLRMAVQGATVIHLPDPLARYRMHPQQKTYGEESPYLPELRQVSDSFRSELLNSQSVPSEI